MTKENLNGPKIKGYVLDKKREGFKAFIINTFWFLFFVYMLMLGISLVGEGLYLIADVNEAAINDYRLAVGFSVTALLYFFLVAASWTNTYVRVFLAVGIFFIIYYIVDRFSPIVFFIIRYATGILTIVVGVLIFINVLRKIRDGVNFIPSLLLSLAYIFIGVLIFLFEDGFYFVTFLYGIYLICFSSNILWQFFTAKTHLDRIRKVKKFITFPTIFSSFLTIGFFRQVEKLAQDNKLEVFGKKIKKDNDQEVVSIKKVFENSDPGLMIFIHIKKGVLNGVGHVDFLFDDKVYCFGEYDEEAQYFKGVFRDGVLAVMTPREHIIRAVTEEEKLLVCYDLKLTQKQKEKVRKRIEQMMSKAYKFQTKAELAANHALPGKPMDYNDNASFLYNQSNAQTYKFSKGSDYKTYYLLGQNCSKVANEMIEATGFKIRKLNGIITPGTYLNFMEELYRMPNSFVRNRFFLRKEN